MNNTFCFQCGNTPCTCGNIYKEESIETIALVLEGLKKILSSKDVNCSIVLDGKQIEDWIISKQSEIIDETSEFTQLPPTWKSYLKKFDTLQEAYKGLNNLTTDDVSIPSAIKAYLTLFDININFGHIIKNMILFLSEKYRKAEINVKFGEWLQDLSRISGNEQTIVSQIKRQCYEFVVAAKRASEDGIYLSANEPAVVRILEKYADEWILNVNDRVVSRRISSRFVIDMLCAFSSIESGLVYQDNYIGSGFYDDLFYIDQEYKSYLESTTNPRFVTTPYDKTLLD